MRLKLGNGPVAVTREKVNVQKRKSTRAPSFNNVSDMIHYADTFGRRFSLSIFELLEDATTMSDTVSQHSMPTWDLTAIYTTTEAWEKDFSTLNGLAEAFARFRGHLGDSATTLKQALEAQDAFNRLAEKLYVYASMKSDEDTRVAENRSRVARVESLFAQLSPNFAWFSPELLALPQETLDALLDAPELAFYRRSLEQLLRERPHILTEAEERLLGTFGDVLGAPSTVFSILNDGDMTFGKLRNGDGVLQELTHGSYHLFMEEKDQNVRKAAFRKLYNAYKKLRNTFATTLDAEVKCHAVSAKVRHYDSALGASLFSDNVPESVYSQLIDTVHSRLNHLQRYLQLRKKLLKLDTLDMYDIYCPLFPECRLSFTWDEAVATVKEALKPMGKEYCDALELAFSQRWIDVPERKGKRSGGYSGGAYDTYPYILLNFHGTLDDVFTLAHELGHSIHSYYSRKNQAFHYADYKIFVAEVASTTNEILLAEYLLKKTDDATVKAYLLSHLADEIRLTVYRQTMFAEFEWMMHKHAENHEPLTADLLEKEYYDLNKTYHGIKADKLIAMEWSRIPHFYYNFYVYKYATGMSAAIQLANRILTGEPKALDDYLGFLKAGCSKDVLDIMRGAGVDLEKPEPVAKALDYFGTLVDRLEAQCLQ